MGVKDLELLALIDQKLLMYLLLLYLNVIFIFDIYYIIFTFSIFTRTHGLFLLAVCYKQISCTVNWKFLAKLNIL